MNGSGNQSRFIRTVRTPLEKRKKVVKIYGAFEDNGEWFYCWHCGAINNVDRNANSDGYGEQRSTSLLLSVLIVFSIHKKLIRTLGDSQTIRLIVSSIRTLGFVFRLGPDGQPMRTCLLTSVKIISKGCWFCGVTNIYGGQSN